MLALGFAVDVFDVTPASGAFCAFAARDAGTFLSAAAAVGEPPLKSMTPPTLGRATFALDSEDLGDAAFG